MKEKKLFLARVLRRTGTLRALHRLSGPSLIVLNYHRIRRSDEPGQIPFEEGVFGPSAVEFEQQMEWLSRNTELLTEGEVIERLANGKKFGWPSALLTFDDGYVDNYETAFPILRKLAIPAIFFIPTGLVTSRRLGWWDIVAYLVKRSTKASISVGSEEISLDDRNAAIRRLCAKFKQPRAGEAQCSVAAIADACDVPVPGVEIQGRELMTWEQIREVSRHGIAIGSHTHNHPVLSTLGRDGQREELRTSKQILEGALGERVRSVAYPFGGSPHYGPDSQSLASECGYELGFSFRSGANRARDLDRYGLRRFKAPEDFDLMVASLLLPGVFA
jgi:peptidoglycan/xylan/chitin deacetylase (PgdA/CDA1 family)